MATHPVRSGDALVVMDVQNDFLPGGTLAVPDGDQVIGPLNHSIALFRKRGLPVFFTRDWHPRNHCSFREQGGPWPPHCVAETNGAGFPAELATVGEAVVISKATTPEKDAYSGFEGTDLADRLRAQHVNRIVVGGLATDYCVLNTVRDGLRLGFAVLLMEDAVRAVDVQPEDGKRALAAMRQLGARLITSESLD
jgi:nicotinamidase-related amidase